MSSFLKLRGMSGGKKISMNEYHSLNPVNCTSAEIQINTKSYVSKLTSCDLCILINILTIILIRIVVGILYFLNPALSIKLEALIITIIVITYISLSCLIIVKIRLTRKILISKQFNIYMNKMLIVFIIINIIDLSLYISYYAMLSDNEIKKNLFILSSTSMLVACMIILIEISYKYYFIANNLLLLAM